MITRKIGKILRGNSTPAQLMLATCFGSLLGFMPGTQAVGMVVLLLLLLCIFNANIWITGLAGLFAKAISIPLMPITFATGRFLLDGPTSGLFTKLINAPVTALLGLEYYVVTGGLLLGLIIGLVTGFLLVRGVKGYRQKMAALEEGSQAYAKWSSKRSVKILTWLIMGSGPKKGYDELLNAKGKAIRWIGVAGAVLFVGLIMLIRMFFTDQIVTNYLIASLEKANGATVDVANAQVDLTEGVMTLDKLAMADPNALDTDLLRAEKITINISASDLLRKRITMDEVTVIDSSSGEKRAVKGSRIGKPVEPSEPPVIDGDAKTVEEYIKQAKHWKDRLSQIREWLSKVSTPKSDPSDKETLEDRLNQQIQQLGYARVAASHLITGKPTLTIIKLTAGKVKFAQLPGQTLDINAANLSTHGHLLDQPTTIDITSSTGDLLFNLAMPNQSTAPGKLKFVGKGFDIDKVAANLKIGDTAALTGGTFDVNLESQLTNTFGTASIDAPLNVTLNNTTFNIAGNSQKVSTLSLPIGLKGPLDNPAVTVDAKALQNVLVNAGVSVLKDKVTDQLKDKLGAENADKVDQVKEGIGKLFGK
ncbi:MAG TPA: hypothetical protein DCM28_07300 [Phycisphaerales bacterium]|nr:hypothetical protein [Phycisphaerales bacterium]HCD31486.1 hypothetical protein [Phycisphaerales bacterium]|tara:strand:+ start:147165 stop:148937 length:1773 start_codon:yes stop_codon:yes gene_type:complete